MRNLKIVKNAYSIMTVCLILVGAILLFWPQMGLDMICKIYGIFLVIYGIAKLSGYFARDLFQLAFQFDLAYGILLIVLGLIVLVRPVQLVSFFCLVLGICILADGLFKIQAASDSKRFGLRPWWLILTLAIMACLAGLLLVFRPMDGARALLVLLGIAMLAEGILNLCVACSMIKIIRHQQPDVLDAEFYEKRG